EPVNDAPHANVLGDARQTRPQTTDATHHQVDRHAGLAGAVQGLDDAVINQRVELGEDPTWLALPGAFSLLVDQLNRAAEQILRRDDQLSPAVALRVTGQQVEQG